jgi:hypothetical protein
LILLDHKTDITPVSLTLPALKVIKNKQCTDLTVVLDRCARGSLYLGNLGLAKMAADLALIIGPAASMMVNGILLPQFRHAQRKNAVNLFCLSLIEKPHDFAGMDFRSAV